MNFLAHLHLAHLADSSLSGNLLADFVRGNPPATGPLTSWRAFLCTAGSTY
jgi:acyl carrier protein phosphodiesterase